MLKVMRLRMDEDRRAKDRRAANRRKVNEPEHEALQLLKKALLMLEHATNGEARFRDEIARLADVCETLVDRTSRIDLRRQGDRRGLRKAA